MAGPYGFETPQEALARRMAEMQAMRQQQQAILAQSSPYTQAGAGYATAFQGIARGIDRLRGKKAPIDPQVAQAAAAENITRPYIEAEAEQIKMGVDPGYARFTLAMDAADKLADAGFGRQADQTRQAAIAAQLDWKKRMQDNAKFKSEQESAELERALKIEDRMSQGDNFYLPYQQRFVNLSRADIQGREEARRQGGFEFSPSATSVQFGPEDLGLTTGARTQIQKDLAATDDALARIEQIASAYEPQFLTYQGKARQFGANLLDKFDMLPTGGEWEEYRNRAEAFHMTAFDHMNRYIKLITGAQMSNMEADRLRKGMADPERDAPGEYKVHLDENRTYMRAARTRYMDMLSKGLMKDGEALPWMYQDADGNWQDNTNHPAYRTIESYIETPKYAPNTPASKPRLSDDEFRAGARKLGIPGFED